ncbi:hypothetical protein FF38_01338 [Lucilia cuprina]|uniref:Uncharacterized protein n=1 Tax=Lucilia cuprina TaxID=7375 RepID=A0A0L0BTH4_LUCCU|nr:hypothetical protein FF38_01338 [Lucilia cuprina]
MKCEIQEKFEYFCETFKKRKVSANVEQNLPSFEIPRESLAEKLKQWFIENKPTIECTNSLLKILKSEQLNVPTSVNGLLGKTIKCVERTVSPGTYVHIGLKQQLEKLAKPIESLKLSEIEVDIGVDGLPIFQYSGIILFITNGL